MPKRTAKPCIRIDSGGPEYVVSFYPVRNMRRFLYKSVTIDKGDTAGFTEQVTALIHETRERYGSQEK